jgi:FkbM family methyltransferase
MIRVYKHPPDAVWRYTFKSGSYPHEFALATPLGEISATAYTPDDLLTINEIFCRQDYACTTTDRVFVDFGSNIGISALYFLSRHKENLVFCFEPLAQNCERLRGNLSSFAGRYQLQECAVGLGDGKVRFGCEPTGRYGGIGMETGTSIEVWCRDANDVLDEVLAEHQRIDVLKIDIEKLEREVLERIGPERLRRIGAIFIEQRFGCNPLPTHLWQQYGGVARFRLWSA